MAKKGEGDPRWIVQEREDGKNVNNWHWTEKDFSEWPKERLCELLSDLPIETDGVIGRTTKVSTTSEVSVNTRKAKAILFYELDCTVSWEAKSYTTDHVSKGTILMPYISDENDDTDFEIRLTTEEGSSEDDMIKDEVRSFMIPILKERVSQMLRELREAVQQKTRLHLKDSPKLGEAAAPTASPTASRSTTSPAPSPTVPKPIKREPAKSQPAKPAKPAVKPTRTSSSSSSTSNPKSRSASSMPKAVPGRSKPLPTKKSVPKPAPENSAIPTWQLVGLPLVVLGAVALKMLHTRMAAT